MDILTAAEENRFIELLKVQDSQLSDLPEKN